MNYYGGLGTKVEAAGLQDLSYFSFELLWGSWDKSGGGGVTRFVVSALYWQLAINYYGGLGTKVEAAGLQDLS